MGGTIMTLDEALEILEEEGYEVKLIEEDFTMGVGAPLGADQGIPHSMQGCAVPMMRLGDPAPYGRIQRLPGPPPRHRMRLPVIAYFGGTKYKLVPRRKRKKKKKK